MQQLILYKIPSSIRNELQDLFEAEKWVTIIQLLNRHRVANNHPLCNSCLTSYQVIKRDLPEIWEKENS